MNFRWSMAGLVFSCAVLVLAFWVANGQQETKPEDRLRKIHRTLEALYGIAESQGDRIEELDAELDRLVGKGEIEDPKIRAFIVLLIKARADGEISSAERKKLDKQLKEILDAETRDETRKDQIPESRD